MTTSKSKTVTAHGIFNINVLNIYRELKKRGYFLGVEYYNLGHPYGSYKRINEYILILEQNIGDIETINELVKELVKIKDFELAFFYASQLQRLDNSDEKQYSMICNIISEINVLMEKALKQIDENNVLMLCVDGLRRKDVSYEYMPKTRKTIDEKGFWLDNAYSYSTSTYESLIPVYSENYDLQTKYYEKNAIEEGECRFVCEAVKQNRNIYFRTDMDRIVSSEKICYSGCFETATEKVWNFILDALEEKNGLFYVHILYESHFRSLVRYFNRLLLLKVLLYYLIFCKKTAERFERTIYNNIDYRGNTWMEYYPNY